MRTPSSAVSAAPVVTAASRAVYVAFAGSGFAFASWASRIPQVRDRLELGPAELGLVLLAVAAGSLIALPSAGAVVARFGSGRTVSAMAVLLAGALAVIATGYLTGVPVLVVGLFLLGFANGAWDVAMNVQGALVERRLGRSIMARYHAGYSLGTVAGALVGAGAVAVGLPVPVHLVLVALLVGGYVVVAVRRFLPDHAEAVDADRATPRRHPLAAWREPRTVLIGVVVLAFAFAEGVGNDWISVAAIDGHGLPEAVGTLVFAVFLAAMTGLRWVGPALLDRYGRVPVVRVLAAVGVLGVLLFVFAPHPGLVVAGAVLWGAGVSLGFPVGMSAGADEPAYAAGRVSVIASIGYCAFLAGPPLIGLLGESYTVLRAVLAVAVLLGLSALLAAVLSPRPPSG